MTRPNCTLCNLPLPKHPVIDEELVFCCMGCHTVHTILSAQSRLANFQDTPLFQQALRSGLISNPALMEQIKESKVELPDQEWQRLHLEIGDLWCPSCCEVIKLILLREKGIRHCVVDYSTDLASVEFAPRYLSKEQIFKLISGLGYSPRALEDDKKRKVHYSLYLRFAIAAFFSLQIMMFSYPIYMEYFGEDTRGYGLLFGWISLASSLPIMGYSFWPIWKRFYHSFRVGVYGMEALVVMGVTTAFGLSVYQLLHGSSHVYFDSMSAIIVFVLLGKIIESRAKFSAKEALLHLHRAVPRRGRKRFADGSLRFVPIKEFAIGDLMVVNTGEKIVLDGVVEEGEGAVDESLMTGEALPVLKNAGSQLLAGTLLKSGTMTVRVVRTLEHSLLQQIVGIVEQEMGVKTHYVRAADLIVRWFVPLIVAIASATFTFVWLFSSLEEAILRAIAILLISCPCAIGIAAPLAESLLMNQLASLGAIVRNRAALRYLGKETRIVFDKTGTLTEGKFTILSGLDRLSSAQQERLKGLAQRSNHPISTAIAESIPSLAYDYERVVEYPGKGLRGEGLAVTTHLGSAAFFRLQEIEVLEQPFEGVITQVYYAENGCCLSTLSLGDCIKGQAIQVVREVGASKVVLLSGDSSLTVSAVAGQCGIAAWYGQQSPLEKGRRIEEMKEKGDIVLMVGDGINDAPALAAAHVGVSVASATDLSIQASDILLTADRLEIIPRMLRLARKGQSVIVQNLFWAFFYNVVGVGLAVFGYFPPIVAALAMVLSSLIVLFNALRLKRNSVDSEEQMPIKSTTFDWQMPSESR